jgi:hypothetical protein
MTFAEERLRFSLVTAANRAPAEQEAPRLIGAAGQPAFENGWSAAAGFGPPAFWKTSSGWVHLSGVIENSGLSGSFQTRMFTLPTAYRPPFEQESADIVVPFGSATTSGGPFTTIDPPLIAVLTIVAESRPGAGEVFVASPGAIFADFPFGVSLDGVAFRTT